jgi:hypothetical protein
VSLNLPSPSPTYDPKNEAQTRDTIAKADSDNQKKRQDFVVDPIYNRLILQSPNGTKWSLTIDNTGVISGTSL